ncbi:neutral/alkaline non-lysosomal ceramidase N-terminal domain-containing protein [Cytobacillus sp. Hz8]|uniref:neutral/alkaline non-lysosomal ceramidase N-terminal domain-containing protein n=1 Tax=Cytobacillus sp. Hz8 TaxID=3347168 RepID=UPI0035D59CBE
MNNFTELRLGVSKVDITPQAPIPLAGFGHRVGNFKGIVRPLFARCFLFEELGNQYLFVTADLLWWGQSFANDLHKSIEETWGIPSDHLILHATHNHSGPQTSDQFVSALGKYDSRYLKRLKMLIYDGICEARKNLESVTVEVGKGLWSGSINRRKVINGICEMAPNVEGINDQTMTVIKYSTQDKKLKGILVHATCHLTTTGDNFVSSEFPGVTMEKLEGQYSDQNVVAGFLQGFCGNIRPALIQNGVFYRGDDSHVVKNGLILLNEVNRVLEIGMKQISTNPIKIIRKTVNLPFSVVPGPEEIREKGLNGSVYREWAQLLLEGKKEIPSYAKLNISYIQFAENLCFLAANAEMVVEYGIFAKEILGDHLLPIGYTNGMIGYIPTEKQLEEGGYEPVESTYYFGLPSQFSPEIEGIIKEVIAQIREESFM